MAYIRKIKNKVIYLIRLILYKNPHIYYAYSALTICQFREIMKGVKFLKSDIILDLGCGDGLLTIIIGKKCGKIYGIDISQESIKKAKTRSMYLEKKVNSEFIVSRMEEARFNSEFFDKIISICVLEHIDNYLEVLKEIYRSLKKGGRFIFSVDSLESIKDTKFIFLHKKKFNVVRYYKITDLKKLLKSIGFVNIKIKSICKGKYAKKLLMKGIYENSNFLAIFSPIEYFILKLREILNKYKTDGLFLVGTCYK